MYRQFHNQAFLALSHLSKEELQELLDNDDKCEQRIDEHVKKIQNY